LEAALPDQPLPLLLAQPAAQRGRRFELNREQALKLWGEKRQQGWQASRPQWALATERQSRDG